MDKENLVPNVAQEKQALDAMEQSVKALQGRIQYLLKEETKHKKKLDETFQNSIRLIERKVQQSEHYRKNRQVKRQHQRESESVQSRAKELREKQQEQLTLVRESLNDVKKAERDSIRQMSKRNQQVIEESRRALLEKKKYLVQQLRQEKEQCRSEIAKQQQERKMEILQAKEQERKSNQQKRMRFTQELKEKETVEKELLDRIRNTSENLHRFSDLVRATTEIKVEEFQVVLAEVKQKEKSSIRQGRFTQKILEYILLNKNPHLKDHQLTETDELNTTKAREMRSTERQRNLQHIYRKVGSNTRKQHEKTNDSHLSTEGNQSKSSSHMSTMMKAGTESIQRSELEIKVPVKHETAHMITAPVDPPVNTEDTAIVEEKTQITSQ